MVSSRVLRKSGLVSGRVRLPNKRVIGVDEWTLLSEVLTPRRQNTLNVPYQKYDGWACRRKFLHQ